MLAGNSASTLSGVISLPAASCAAWIAIAARLANAAVTRSTPAAIKAAHAARRPDCQ